MSEFSLVDKCLYIFHFAGVLASSSRCVRASSIQLMFITLTLAQTNLHTQAACRIGCVYKRRFDIDKYGKQLYIDLGICYDRQLLSICMKKKTRNKEEKRGRFLRIN